LGFVLLNKGYFKNSWLTFNQVKDLGGAILKGEKSCPIVFYKTGYIDANNAYYTEEKIAWMSEQEKSSKGLTSIPI
jgi:antirestriction protein ArdC